MTVCCRMVALKVMQLEEWIATLRDDPEDPSGYISTKFLSEQFKAWPQCTTVNPQHSREKRSSYGYFSDTALEVLLGHIPNKLWTPLPVRNTAHLGHGFANPPAFPSP